MLNYSSFALLWLIVRLYWTTIRLLLPPIYTVQSSPNIFLMPSKHSGRTCSHTLNNKNMTNEKWHKKTTQSHRQSRLCIQIQQTWLTCFILVFFWRLISTFLTPLSGSSHLRMVNLTETSPTAVQITSYIRQGPRMCQPLYKEKNRGVSSFDIWYITQQENLSLACWGFSLFFISACVLCKYDNKEYGKWWEVLPPLLNFIVLTYIIIFVMS